MYAIIETGGKQYRVELGTEFEVERLAGDPGGEIVLDRVLLVADGESAAIGRPLVSGAEVHATVVRQDRGEKIVVFKYKPKTRHRAKRGHRQELTVLRVADIVHGGRSAAGAAAAVAKETEAERAKAARDAAEQAARDAALAAELARKAAAARAEATTAEKAPARGRAKPEAKAKAELKSRVRPKGKTAEPEAKPEARTARKAPGGSPSREAAKTGTTDKTDNRKGRAGRAKKES